MKIIVAGGSGYIGRALTASLVRDGHSVVVLTRDAQRAKSGHPNIRNVAWNPRAARAPWIDDLAEADGIVNLAGENIGTRPWTGARRRAISESRLDATRAIVEALDGLAPDRRPRVLVNASGIDYYGDRPGDEELAEDAAPGDSFLASMTVSWEAAAAPAEALGTRVVLLRTALVISREATALRLMALPYRVFLGGRLGSGRQWFPWIHLADAVGIYRFALEHEALRGPVNTAAPDTRRQAEFAAELGRALGRPSWLPAPAALLRLPLRGQADLFLHGRRPSVRKVVEAGYRYRYPDLAEALGASFRTSPEVVALPSAR